MTPAEFDTRRRAIGMRGEDVARMLDVQPRLVQRWSAGTSPLPEFAVDALEAVEDTMHGLVEQLVHTITTRSMAGPLDLVRYRTADAYADSIDGDQLPFAAHAIYIAWASDALAAEGIATRIVWDDEVA